MDSTSQQTSGCEIHWHLLNGDRDAARKVLSRREDLIGTGGDFSYVLGNQALNLGEVDRAMDWFELALEKRDQRIVFIRTDLGDHELLKTNPRFQALLKKMNLDEVSMREMGYL